VGYRQNHISLSVQGYVMGYAGALVGGALYLGLGQMIAGLLKNAETVNATTRLVYFVFIMVGMFGEIGFLGNELKQVVHWSPYGTVKTVLSSGMQPGLWHAESWMALMATIGYALAFCFLGIRWFRWNTK
jgi:ABC-2 type transport system permease protein